MPQRKRALSQTTGRSAPMRKANCSSGQWSICLCFPTSSALRPSGYWSFSSALLLCLHLTLTQGQLILRWLSVSLSVTVRQTSFHSKLIQLQLSDASWTLSAEGHRRREKAHSSRWKESDLPISVQLWKKSSIIGSALKLIAKCWALW